MRISVCVPMYNESKIIADTARKMHEYLCDRFGDDFELIFSDDGSLDNSADIVRSLQLKNVKVIGYEKNSGKGCAVRTAILASTGETVVFTDADLAYGLDVIEESINILEKTDYDMLIASRAIHERGYEGYTPLRKVASKCYKSILNIFCGIKVSDAQCGFKAFTAKAAKSLFSLCETDNFAFDLEVILLAQKMRLKIFELPAMIINHRDSNVNILRDAPRMLREAQRIKNRVNNCKHIQNLSNN